MANFYMKPTTVKAAIVFMEKVGLLLIRELLKYAPCDENFIHIKRALTLVFEISLSFTMTDAPVHLHLSAWIFE